MTDFLYTENGCTPISVGLGLIYFHLYG